MDSSQFREAARASIDDIIDYYDTIEDRKVVSAVEPGYLRKLIPASAPEDPEPWETIHADVSRKILPGITHWQSPHFMAFFPAMSSYPAMVAELYSNAFNGAHFNWICSPAVTELETIVLDWLARLLHLPDCYLSTAPTGGGGVIHGSASEAILTVMVAARDKYIREATGANTHLEETPEEASTPNGSTTSTTTTATKTPPTEEETTAKEEQLWRLRSRLVALGSAASHSSTKKAAQILGVRFRTVPVSAESSYAMTGPALASVLADCRREGLEPFYLTATLGTTDTCAVDDFEGIAEALRADQHRSSPETDNAEAQNPVKKGGSIWVHVDAAYAGSALILPQHAPLTTQFPHFHSFNLNPHKWLLTNFDCSALYVRDRAWLVESLSIKPSYLRNRFSEAGLVTDYRDWQIPLGRRFRSLKLWFVLRSFGASGLRAHVRRGVELSEYFTKLLGTRGDLFEVLTGPRFGLVVFRCLGAGTGVGVGVENGEGEGEGDGDGNNKLTEAVLEKVNHTGELYLTPTVLNGVYAIRVCTTTSPKMEERHMERAFGILVKEVEELRG